MEEDRLIGTYRLTSHFWGIFTHPGRLVFTKEDGVLKGKAFVPGIEAEAEDLTTDGHAFSFVMRKKLAGIRVEMETSGTIEADGTLHAIMRAPFGTSRIEGCRVEEPEEDA